MDLAVVFGNPTKKKNRLAKRGLRRKIKKIGKKNLFQTSGVKKRKKLATRKRGSLKDQSIHEVIQEFENHLKKEKAHVAKKKKRKKSVTRRRKKSKKRKNPSREAAASLIKAANATRKKKRRKTKKRKSKKRKNPVLNAVANPKKKKRKTRRKTSKKRRRKNPTLSAVAVNPKKRRKKSKKVSRKTKKRRNPKSRKKVVQRVRRGLRVLSKVKKAKKGGTFRYKKKRFKRVNPNGVTNMKWNVKNLTGHDVGELGTLAAGGLGMSVLEGVLKKFAPTVSDRLVVAGTSVGPLALAIATHALVKNAQAKRLSKGVVAASLVKLSLDLGKEANVMLGLPNANAGAMSGVKLFETNGMGRARIFPSTMKGVKIVPREPESNIPGMGATPKLVDQDPGDFGRMGGIDTRGDFGARQYQSDAADFGAYPQVIPESQMGEYPTYDEDLDI